MAAWQSTAPECRTAWVPEPAAAAGALLAAAAEGRPAARSAHRGRTNRPARMACRAAGPAGRTPAERGFPEFRGAAREGSSASRLAAGAQTRRRGPGPILERGPARACWLARVGPAALPQGQQRVLGHWERRVLPARRAWTVRAEPAGAVQGGPWAGTWRLRAHRPVGRSGRPTPGALRRQEPRVPLAGHEAPVRASHSQLPVLRRRRPLRRRAMEHPAPLRAPVDVRYLTALVITPIGASIPNHSSKAAAP